jgi:hypothetical protein
MNTNAMMDGRKRPKRIAKKVAKRGGFRHYAGWSEAQWSAFEASIAALNGAVSGFMAAVSALGALDEFRTLLKEVAP